MVYCLFRDPVEEGVIRFGGGHFYRSPYCICTMYIYTLHFSLFRTAYSSLH